MRKYSDVKNSVECILRIPKGTSEEKVEFSQVTGKSYVDLIVRRPFVLPWLRRRR